MDAPRLDNKTEFVATPLMLLAKDGERLVRSGITSLEEVIRVTRD